jgi:hypothetical protein
MQGIFLVELGSDPTWLHFALARPQSITDLGRVSGMNLQSSIIGDFILPISEASYF